MVEDHALSSERVALERFSPLHLISNTPKGRGVFAGQHIPSGTIIDTSPVLVLDPVENVKHIEKTSLYHYTYNWPLTGGDGKPKKTQAVVFGLGSMFNHSRQDQNVGWKRDLQNHLIIYRALKDIRQGEELCISYGDHLTFEDADGASTGNETSEEAEDVLGRIDIDIT